MLKIVMLAVAGAQLLGCVGKASKSPAPKDKGSQVTSIGVSPPDKRALVASAPQIDVLMNSFLFVADPSTPGCQPGAQRIEQIGDYNNASSQASLLQGCDYSVSLAFGNRDAGARVLKAVYLRNNTPFIIRKEDTAGRPTFNTQIAVQVQPEGAALGLRPPQNTGNVGPNNPPPVNPGAAPNLPGEKNLAMIGNTGPLTLSQVFKGEYLVIDLSSINCHYCVERAKETDADQQLQQLLNGTKCSRITLVDSLSGWQGLGFGSSSFIGQNSYEVAMTATAAGRKLGVQVTGTPFYLVLDRAGNVLPNTEVNSEPLAIIQSKCR